MKRAFLYMLLFYNAISASVVGQSIDSLKTDSTGHRHESSATLLIYTRTIADASGTVRFDLNAVPNFRVAKWLRVELGLRHGERSGDMSAYDHYKVELQTSSLVYHTRLVARMSDNIVRYGSPNFSRTNYLLIAETRVPLSTKFDAFVNLGYEISYLKSDVLEAIPELSGAEDDHAIYKFVLRYKLKEGFVEAVLGTYDVFNPYSLSQPFLQTSFEYELWNRASLYSYLRYQFDKSVGAPFNNFLGLGVRFSLTEN